MSWRQWTKTAVTGEDDFIAKIASKSAEEAEYKHILETFPMSVPEYYLALANLEDPDDPIRKMCVPSLAETDMTGRFDTSGESDNTKITGLQHKYGETALVLSTHNCAMYCRHCFRKRLVGLSGDEVLSHLDDMLEYISSHKEISNVLVSGGDAFMNSNAAIDKYLEALCKVEQLDFIRFGTRTPVVLPQRIYEDKELLGILKKHGEKKEILVVTQFNHPRELTQQAKMAIDALQEIGVEVKNQTVLLRGVNDNPDTLSELMRGLTSFGITPYYVFQCRPVSGVGTQFQVPLAEGSEIVDKAKSKLGGPAKCFRYVMSHVTGKIEILGSHNGEMLFKYHQAKYEKDSARIFTLKLREDQTWLEDIPV